MLACEPLRSWPRTSLAFDGERGPLGVLSGSTSSLIAPLVVDAVVAQDPLRCKGFGLLGAKDGVFGMGGKGSVGGAEGGGTRGLPGLARPLKVRLFGERIAPDLPLGEKADNDVVLRANAAGRPFLCFPTAFASAAS